MNSLAVIVPVKPSGKSRLSPVLSQGERRALVIAMFRGVMKTVERAGLLGSCRVVSSDARVLRAAATFGASPVAEERDSGVNSAVSAGMMGSPASEFLVLPSDLPFLRATDLLGLLQIHAGRPRVVLAPSSTFDGTNALLLPRTPPLALSFDKDSFWNHLEGASRLGLPVGVCTRKGFLFDVDSPGDLRRLARSAPRTEIAELAGRALA